MAFWITSSIVLFIVIIISAFGPLFGLYGDMKYNKKGDDRR